MKMRCARQDVVRGHWKCAAYDGPSSADTGNALRTTERRLRTLEMRRVRRAVVRVRRKCAAYDEASSRSDGFVSGGKEEKKRGRNGRTPRQDKPSICLVGAAGPAVAGGMAAG